MLRIILTIIVLLASTSATPDEQQPPEADRSTSLAELASAADVIVVAQVRDTDYIYQREFPVEGSAFLKVLIAYKADKPLDMIEVYEKGLHAHECYFQEPAELTVGRRYLLFLQHDASQPDRYRGLPQGCKLDILVARDNRYVLRLPADGIRLSDALAARGKELEFADANALEDEAALSPQRRDALLSAGWIRPSGERYVYTHGVELPTVRELMGIDGISTALLQKGD